jgi:hypothetical protein
MREVYTNVLERLLIVQYEREDEEPKYQFLVNNEDSVSSWPPFPWPPRGGDGDDDDDDDGPKHGPKNATELAEEVVKFELKLARASLDLLVRLLLDDSRSDNHTETFYTKILCLPTTRSLFPTSLRQ